MSLHDESSPQLSGALNDDGWNACQGGARDPLAEARQASLAAHACAADNHGGAALATRLLCVDQLVVDVPAREVSHRGKPVTLTRQEFELLRFLVEHRDQVFSREELRRRVWAERELDSLRTVDIHVHRLRIKLGAPFYGMIETVRQVGYKLRSVRSLSGPTDVSAARPGVRNA